MADIDNMASLRQWLRRCPSVAQSDFVGVDFLMDNPDKFALSSAPSVLRQKENIVGRMRLLPVQEQTYYIDYRADFGQQTQQNLDNLALFQAIHRWIYDRNNAQDFPPWDGGTVKSIVPTATPTLMEVAASTARYRMPVRVTYRVEA